MQNKLLYGMALFAAPVAYAFGSFALDKPGEAARTRKFDGQVVALAPLIEKFGTKLDPEAAPHWLALKTEDGKIYPLIEDDGSRMFFKDAKLLDRPMQVAGRLFPGSQLLQAAEIHSYHAGKLHEIYYWCNVCSIKRFEKKLCDCCGGPMELREVLVPK
jgi:hypothetical protein